LPPKILAAPNQRSLAMPGWVQQTYFQLRAAFLSLAPSSAKGYYATATSSTFLAQNSFIYKFSSINDS